eukprot:1134175-Pyramimonas_sp.AAC.2
MDKGREFTCAACAGESGSMPSMSQGSEDPLNSPFAPTAGPSDGPPLEESDGGGGSAHTRSSRAS